MMAVVGVGAAIVDSLSEVDESTIATLGLRKNGMTLVTAHQQRDIASIAQFFQRSPGGSVSNTMCTLARLGTPAAMCAAYCDDEEGRVYRSALHNYGVLLNEPLAASDGHVTSHAQILITPDAGRTMAVHIGASALVDSAALPEDWLIAAQMLVVEGYMWCSDATAAAAEAIIARKPPATALAITAPDAYHCAQLQARLRQNMHAADMVFANQQEYAALIGVSEQETFSQVLPLARLTLITREAMGVTAVTASGERYDAAAEAIAAPIDTTGAGDAFAAAFLHRHLSGASLEESLQFANTLAARFVGVHGAHAEVL